VTRIFTFLATLLAALMQWLRGEDRTETRVRRLEDATARERARQLEDFDAQAANVRTADDAVELLRDVTRPKDN
jgi:hypothetical protein